MADLPVISNDAQPTLLVDATVNTQVASVGPDGSISTNGSRKATYSAAALNLVVAASPTDVFTITGSATKTVRVVRFAVSVTATTEAVINVVLLKRSTANSAGISTSPTRVAHDSGDAAATATVLAYTANPTTGTLVGNIRVLKAIATSTGPGQPGNTVFYIRPEEIGKPWILKGTSEVLAINLNSTTLTGNNFDIDVAWTEE